MGCMGDVVDLATWRDGRQRTEPPAGGAARRPASEPRSIMPSWHPSLGWDGSHDARSAGPTRADASAVDEPAPRGMDALTIARLDRAVASIDRATARLAAKGGRLAPDVETELLALVAQISLGMIREAADRAERMARGLRGAASSGP